jgi:hypothetical protein
MPVTAVLARPLPWTANRPVRWAEMTPRLACRHLKTNAAPHAQHLLPRASLLWTAGVTRSTLRLQASVWGTWLFVVGCHCGRCGEGYRVFEHPDASIFIRMKAAGSSGTFIPDCTASHSRRLEPSYVFMSLPESCSVCVHSLAGTTTKTNFAVGRQYIWRSVKWAGPVMVQLTCVRGHNWNILHSHYIFLRFLVSFCKNSETHLTDTRAVVYCLNS